MLVCAATFAGRPPQLRSLVCRAPGRLTASTAQYWLQRWHGCLPPPTDAKHRSRRLSRDLDRHRRLRADIDDLDDQIVELLAGTD